MIKNKGFFIFWLGLLLIIMFVMFRTSGTPYKEQDIKPLLREYIHLSPTSLPHIAFTYDHTLVTTADPYDFIEFMIRKLGHVMEYMVLSFVVLHIFLQITIRRALPYFISFLLSFYFALSDEWHQSFVAGRTGHLIDVITFDLCGILLGLIIGYWLRPKRRMRKERDHNRYL
ncbi:VanZ family protein [Camelliibacillus cellulosilyticus]|uniref:VanZ family protein n=1 Tax=Camelliibacillus cellulosilyticus TaxID=2174486 RepID=A0ABV9GLQ6_9BACL